MSLGQTCGPVAWAGGRWPNLDWRRSGLDWVGWEDGRVVRRRAEVGPAGALLVWGSAAPEADRNWAERVLGVAEALPPDAGDPTLAALRARFPGLRPFAYGSVFDGLVAAVVGQSISVASAAVTQRRLAALFAPAVETDGRDFFPLPLAEQLADASAALVRTSGVTWRRAEALVAAGRAAAEGALPDRETARADPAGTMATLRALPLVGPWTAASTLLWGVAAPDAYPGGDVALLRAARAAYADPGLDMKGLDRLAEGWRPVRGWAARWLWTALLGAAP